ncbi:MAG: MarR family winged helix-turn-helix transcriptional regulator [Lachnospiraceae bacterium]|nr:MarR family winged helix-turn-helix transcriptional regulator [Lachnospiraceae bacterium]
MTLRPLPKQNELNRLNKALSELYHDLCVQLGMSDSVFDIFYAIAALGDGCRQRDICDYAFTSKQTIHSSIHKLEKEGFLSMKPGKGREMHIFLTPAGEQFTQEKIAPIIAMENEVLSQLPPDEIDQLICLMEKCLGCLRVQCRRLLETTCSAQQNKETTQKG